MEILGFKPLGQIREPNPTRPKQSPIPLDFPNPGAYNGPRLGFYHRAIIMNWQNRSTFRTSFNLNSSRMGNYDNYTSFLRGRLVESKSVFSLSCIFNECKWCRVDDSIIKDGDSTSDSTLKVNNEVEE